MKHYLKILFKSILIIFMVGAIPAIAQTTLNSPSSSDIACFFSWYEKYTFLALNNQPTTQVLGKLVYKKYQNGAILGTINNRVFMRDKMGDKITDRGDFSLHISAALASNCGAPVVSTSEPCPVANLGWTINGNKCQALTFSVLSGISVSVGNTAFGKEGHAEFSCDNGVWNIKSSASCAPISVALNSVDGGDGDGGDGGGGVGDGVPIANAPITLVDAKGKTIKTTTDSKGDYRVSLKGLTPPYIVKVTRPDGTEWYSPSLGESDATGFVRMNITGLTDKVANYVADSVGIQGGAAKVNPSVLLMNPTALQAAKNKLNAGLLSPLTYAGINPVIFDPVRNNYVAAKGDKYDGMLDRLVVTKNKVQGNTVVVGTFAGVNEYLVDGVGAAATFNRPYGIALDSMGNFYVTDSQSHVIRKITPSGMVSILAGNGVQGFSDGVGSIARFNNPQGIAIDVLDNIYVADTYNHAIRKITLDGVVTTLAGNGIKGFLNGAGKFATFNTPVGVAVNKGGDIYITDTLNYVIRKVTSVGIVSTFAGNGIKGYINGFSADAMFNSLGAIGVDSKGNVYVGDEIPDYSIRKINLNGLVNTFFINKSEFSLNGVFGIAINANDDFYISSFSKIGKLSKDMEFSYLAGNSDILSSVRYKDGKGSSAYFWVPHGIAVNKTGDIFVADSGNNAVRKIVSEEIVSTLAGGGSGKNNSFGDLSRFNNPSDIVLDDSGNIFVVDKNNGVIRKVVPSGLVTVFSGRYVIRHPLDDIFYFESEDGDGVFATFDYPRKVAMDLNKNIYVTEFYWIRKIMKNGSVETLSLSNKKIKDFQGIVVDRYGYIYVSAINDKGLRFIYKIAPSGAVTLFLDKVFYGDLSGMAIDKNGNIYVSDTDNHSIIKITPAGVVNTVAGSGVSGLVDGISSSAQFSSPMGLTIDDKGNIFVADTGNNAIRKIDLNGVVTTIAGNGQSGYSNGKNTPIITFNSPQGIAVDKNGHLFVADTGNNAIRVILP